MEQLEPDSGITILDVLEVELCARAILDSVPIRQLVRSELVCRRWQWIIHQYLRGLHHTQILYNVYTFYLKAFRKACPYKYTIIRQTNMYFAHQSLLLACKALEKFRPLQEKTNELFNNIETGCPYLQHLKLLSENKECMKNIKQLRMSELFNNKRKNAFSISKPYVHLNGDISKLIQSNTLTFKTVISALDSLRNVTTLNLDDHNMMKRDFVYFLLNTMPQLEYLSFCNYTCKYTAILHNDLYVVTNDQLIESISRLTNLRSLRMRNNTLVDAELLKALAKCEKLEYLDISFDNIYNNWPKNYNMSDVAALCGSSPWTVITLCLGYIQNHKGQFITNYVSDLPIVQELEILGCYVESPFEATCVSQLKRPLELRVTRANDNQEKTEKFTNLKIVLNTDVSIGQQFPDPSII